MLNLVRGPQVRIKNVAAKVTKLAEICVPSCLLCQLSLKILKNQPRHQVGCYSTASEMSIVQGSLRTMAQHADGRDS